MISAFPDDVDLKKTQVVALINLSRYVEALGEIPSSSAFDFERAYLQYKLGQFHETLQLSASRNEKPFRLLRAQSVRKK